MNTNAQAARSPHLLIWIAGIAVILFSVAGIAAIMGWIPTSRGDPRDAAATSAPAKVSKNEARPAAARPPAPAQPRTPPVQVASSTATRTVCSDCGVVESIREITTKGKGTGIGAVGGAVVGGLIGNQVGSGRGNTAATVIGAVGGAVGGNEVEKRMKSDKDYEVTVRLNDGSSRVITEETPPGYRSGDHVKIVAGRIQAN